MRRMLAIFLTAVVLAGSLPPRAISQTGQTGQTGQKMRRRVVTTPESLPDGVAAKDVRFYSEGVECHGKIFTPKNFSATSNAPAVALAPDWGETAAAIEKYAAHFASRGLVAMVIDY